MSDDLDRMIRDYASIYFEDDPHEASRYVMRKGDRVRVRMRDREVTGEVVDVDEDTGAATIVLPLQDPPAGELFPPAVS